MTYDAANDDYRLVGDDQANVVQIALIGDGFTYRVSGVNTAINGKAYWDVPVAWDDLTSGFDIRTGDGNDLVLVEPGFYNDIYINTGDGNDGVRMRTANVDDLMIKTGNGSDFVQLVSGTDVFGDLYIHTGADNDSISLSVIPTERVAGNSYISGGTGADMMTGSFFDVGGTQTVTGVELIMP
jgi:hypothetical protein